MKIYNTATYFLENYIQTERFLRDYHERYSPHFKEYFLYHCNNIDEKIRAAIDKYPSKMSQIKEANSKIESLIRQVVAAYEDRYHVKFLKDIHIIVGCYGSNAFTHRQIIPEVTFCLEKLSPKDEHLNVIIAHEFGHALHNILTDQSEMDWSALQWFNPYTWLLQEGCATYFSKQIAVADESVYFSYDESGSEWLKFAKDKKDEIITSFQDDLNKKSHLDVFREWFSINGGKHFGHTRLGYYIGYICIEFLIEKYGELKSVTLWREPNFSDEMEQVLIALKDT